MPENRQRRAQTNHYLTDLDPLLLDWLSHGTSDKEERLAGYRRDGSGCVYARWIANGWDKEDAEENRMPPHTARQAGVFELFSKWELCLGRWEGICALGMAFSASTPTVRIQWCGFDRLHRRPMHSIRWCLRPGQPLLGGTGVNIVWRSSLRYLLFITKTADGRENGFGQFGAWESGQGRTVRFGGILPTLW